MFVCQAGAAALLTAPAFLLAQTAGASAVAGFGVVQRICSVFVIASALLMTPLWPAYGEAYARGDHAWVRRTFRRSLRDPLCDHGAAAFLARLVPAHTGAATEWPGGCGHLALVLATAGLAVLASTRHAVSMLVNGCGYMRRTALGFLFGQRRRCDLFCPARPALARRARHRGDGRAEAIVSGFAAGRCPGCAEEHFMRVLLIHNFYQQFGGEDAVVQAEKAMLESHGVEVRLYSRHNDEIKEFGLCQKLGFPLHTISSPKTAADLPKVIAEFEPDFAYLHNLYPLISPAVYETLTMPKACRSCRSSMTSGRSAQRLAVCQGKVCERCLGGNHWHAVAQGCYRDSRLFSGIYAATPPAGAEPRLARSGGWLCLPHAVCETEAGRSRHRGDAYPRAAQLQSTRARSRPSSAWRAMRSIWAALGGKGRRARWSKRSGKRRMCRWSSPGTGPLEAELRELVADAREHIRFTGFLSRRGKARRRAACPFSVMCVGVVREFPGGDPGSVRRGQAGARAAGWAACRT